MYGYPRPQVAWSHGDEVLEESARLTLEDNNGWSYLKLKGSSTKDAGIYRVTAENKAGKDQAEFVVNLKGAWEVNAGISELV